MPRSTPVAESAFSHTLKAILRKKIVLHRRQHWINRRLNELAAALEEWHRQYPGAELPKIWLVRYRATFRSMTHSQSSVALRYYLDAGAPALAPLAVWLLGRSTARSQLYDLPYFAQSDSPAVRRHAARALRRLEAWSQLAQAARLFPEDVRLQWYAHASIIKRPHDERLRNLTRYVDATNAAAASGPSRMPLWLGDVDWIRRPPKSVEYIRRILMHLRRLVRGSRA